MQLEWRNSEKSMLAVVDGNYTRIVEEGDGDWHTLSNSGNITPYSPPNAQEVLILERKNMSCTPAQMRLTLHTQGLLGAVQAIAESDPEASIVWEYATKIVRNSPLISSLAGDFTEEQIDELFRSAMSRADY